MTPRVGRRHRAVVRVGGGLPVDVSARFPCRSSVARQRTAASRPRPNECRSSVVSNWSVGAGRRCKIRDDDEHQPLLLSRRRGAASHRCTALFVAERALAVAGRTSGPRRGARLRRGSALGLRRAGHISSSSHHVDVGFCHRAEIPPQSHSDKKVAVTEQKIVTATFMDSGSVPPTDGATSLSSPAAWCQAARRAEDARAPSSSPSPLPSPLAWGLERTTVSDAPFATNGASADARHRRCRLAEAPSAALLVIYPLRIFISS